MGIGDGMEQAKGCAQECSVKGAPVTEVESHRIGADIDAATEKL